MMNKLPQRSIFHRWGQTTPEVELRASTMKEIKNDAFYDLVKQYDSDREHHLVGEVDYYLLEDNKPYEGLNSHREALNFVFGLLMERR